MNIILFESDSEAAKRGAITSALPAYGHILNVLRLKKGDSFRCGIWSESEGVGTISSISTERIIFSYRKTRDAGRGIGLYVIVSYMRPICAKRVVRFAGQAGFSGLAFVPTALAEKSYMESSFYADMEYMGALRQGCEISKSAFKPDMFMADSIAAGLRWLSEKGISHRYVLHPDESSRKLMRPLFGPAALAIGGERGWTDAEVAMLKSKGFSVRNIGRRVLRSEESVIACAFPWL